MSGVKFEPFQRVLVRDSNRDRWLPDIFRIFDDCNTCPYYCLYSNYRQCIPYEGNEHLLGTTDAPEPWRQKFQWGEHVEAKDELQECGEPAIYLSPITNHPILRHRVIYKDTVTPCCVAYCHKSDW